MVGLKKRGVITAVAGILAAVTITGCSAAPDNDATVVTVGTEKVSYGVANFYARMISVSLIRKILDLVPM